MQRIWFARLISIASTPLVLASTFLSFLNEMLWGMVLDVDWRLALFDYIETTKAQAIATYRLWTENE